MPTKRPTVKQLRQELDITRDALTAALSVRETDSNFFTGGLSPLYDGRLNWDRKKIFAESLRAWRVNPIARRIVKLMTSFAIGKGLTIKSEDAAAQAFLDEWTTHPLNDFKRKVKRWKDEDTRTGNLFFLFTVDPAGMKPQVTEEMVRDAIRYRWLRAHLYPEGVMQINHSNVPEDLDAYIDVQVKREAMK
jgi:hypothetical protein